MKSFAEILIEGDFKIADENSLKITFSTMVSTIKNIRDIIQEIGSEFGVNLVLYESSDSRNELFNNALSELQRLNNKVKKVENMIYEYVTKTTITEGGVENIFIPLGAPNVVNDQTAIAQVVVERYEDGPSIEVPCQIYDAAVNSFNNAINVMNNVRNLSIPEAEPSNLTTIYQANPTSGNRYS